jgi:ssDNA-binding replication factor A large subunit
VIGDICAFEHEQDLVIGRILQFVKYGVDSTKQIPLKGNYANINDKVGILATWYHKHNNNLTYKMNPVCNTEYIFNSALCVYYNTKLH